MHDCLTVTTTARPPRDAAWGCHPGPRTLTPSPRGGDVVQRAARPRGVQGGPPHAVDEVLRCRDRAAGGAAAAVPEAFQLRAGGVGRVGTAIFESVDPKGCR